MSETSSVGVPEAARRLGVTERTIWRRLRGGTLRGRRVGRRVLVDLPSHVVAEAPTPYLTALESSPWRAGPWPYTEDVVERHSRALLLRRRAAAADMDRLAADSRPDPYDLSAVEYLRAERDGMDPTDAQDDRP